MNPQQSTLPDEYPDRPYVIQVKHATFGVFCIETSTPEHNAVYLSEPNPSHHKNGG